MKNFNVKQSSSEVILEEVIEKWINYENSEGVVGTQLNPNWTNTPLILTSIDHNIKPGDLIREDQLEPDQWQCWYNEKWNNVSLVSQAMRYKKDGLDVRQVAKLKQPIHETPSTEMCEDCKGHGWRMNPNSVDDSGICPSCNGTGGVHETQESVHDLETCTEKEEKLRKLLNEHSQSIIATYVLHEDTGEVRDKHDKVTLGVLGCDIFYLDDLIKLRYKAFRQSEKGTGETPIQEPPDNILARKVWADNGNNPDCYSRAVYDAMKDYRQNTVQEHKPESEENRNAPLVYSMACAMEYHEWVEWMQKQGFEITKKK